MCWALGSAHYNHLIQILGGNNHPVPVGKLRLRFSWPRPLRNRASGWNSHCKPTLQLCCRSLLPSLPHSLGSGQLVPFPHPGLPEMGSGCGCAVVVLEFKQDQSSGFSHIAADGEQHSMDTHSFSVTSTLSLYHVTLGSGLAKHRVCCQCLQDGWLDGGRICSVLHGSRGESTMQQGRSQRG